MKLCMMVISPLLCMYEAIVPPFMTMTAFAAGIIMFRRDIDKNTSVVHVLERSGFRGFILEWEVCEDEVYGHSILVQ